MSYALARHSTRLVGHATLPNKIASCNGIVNVSRIYVGTKLAIPVAPWSPIPAGPVAVKQFTPGGTVPTRILSLLLRCRAAGTTTLWCGVTL